jgi:hypothetical protein
MTNPLFYSLIFLGTVLVATVAAMAAWYRRHAPGGLVLFLMLVAVFLWNLAGMMEVSAVGLGDKIIWSKIMYLGAHTTPPLFLIFALDYTHRRKWLTAQHRLPIQPANPDHFVCSYK